RVSPATTGQRRTKSTRPNPDLPCYRAGVRTVHRSALPAVGAPAMSIPAFSRRRFLGHALAAVGGGVFLRSAVHARGRRAATLRELADARGLWVGPAVGYNALAGDATYRAVLAREFNILTPENAMKWSAIHPGQGRYSWTQADALVNFAADNGMAVHGHTLVWHSQNPAWLT